MSLKLVEATEFSVEVVMQKGRNEQTFPLATTIKYSFPARGDFGPVDVYWYDGHWAKDPNLPDDGDNRVYNRPERPAGIPEDQILGDDNLNGSFIIGEKGHRDRGRVRRQRTPDARRGNEGLPEAAPRPSSASPARAPTATGSTGIKEGYKPASNFDYAGPFTEMVNFGNLVVKSGKKLVWDNVNGVVKNVSNPAEIVSKEYRKGWELPC